MKPGTDCWGFQIFVNLHTENQMIPPRAFHADLKDIPVLKLDAGEIRVVCGQLAGVPAPLNELATPVDILDVPVKPDSKLAITLENPYNYFVFCISGSGMINDAGLSDSELLTFNKDAEDVQIYAQSEPMRLLLAGGSPLNQPAIWGGPFAQSSNEAIREAKKRFAAGEMGSLSPSF